MAGDMRVSMLFEANAAQAKAEVAAMRAEIERIGPAGDVAAQGTAAAAASGAEWGSMVQMLRASVQPMIGEALALAEATRQVSAMEEMGVLSAQEAAQAHDLLARQAIELQARMDAAGVSMDGATAAIIRQETAVQQLIGVTTGLGQATNGTVADTLRHGQMLDDLRARYNPLFAASRQYEIALRDIAEAERMGAISAIEAGAARDRAAQMMAPVPAMLGRVGTASQATTQHVLQLGYQLNDIGMMMALGQSPFALMMQQGPQVVQVFANMRAEGVALRSALVGAFTSFLNPVGLATMAVIGFGAAAVQWLTNSGEAAETFEQSIDRANDAISRMQRLTADLTERDLEGLRKKYGQVTDQVLALTAAQVAQANGEARRSLATSLNDVQDQFGSSLLQSFVYRGPGDAGSEQQTEFVDNLQSQLQVTREEALSLAQAMEQAFNPENAQAQAQALGVVRGVLQGIAGSGREGADAAAALLVKFLEAEDTALQLAEAERDAALAAIQLAGVDIAANISAALGPATSLAAKLWDAAAAAVAASRAQAQLDAMKIEFSPGGQAMMKYGSRTPGGTSAQNSLADRNTPKSTGSAGGGGGGADAEADAVGNLIRKLREEQELLRETDPIQKEMIRHREALANATEDQKREVEAYIRSNYEERAAMESLRATADLTGTALIDALMGGKDAGEQLVQTLLKAGMQAAILGQGPLAGFFGTGDNGGLFGLLFPTKKADGGQVFGPGGPRDDAVPAWLSNGEYVVNAEATQANLPILEALNRGVPISSLMHWIGGRNLMHRADGGLVGSVPVSSAPMWVRTGTASTSGTGGGRPESSRPIVQIINNSPEPIREQQSAGPDAEAGVTLIVGRQTARGKFDKQNRSRFGLTPKVTSR